MNVDILGIVENMSYFICPNCKSKHFIFGEGGGKSLSERFNLDLLAQIPLDSSIREIWIKADRLLILVYQKYLMHI